MHKFSKHVSSEFIQAVDKTVRSVRDSSSTGQLEYFRNIPHLTKFIKHFFKLGRTWSFKLIVVQMHRKAYKQVKIETNSLEECTSWPPFLIPHFSVSCHQSLLQPQWTMSISQPFMLSHTSANADRLFFFLDFSFSSSSPSLTSLSFSFLSLGTLTPNRSGPSDRVYQPGLGHCIHRRNYFALCVITRH